ncbi:MAG TPA: hypothetical protein VFF50_06325 [Candidatus Deferrimicrobiaceae bacterium]|nr:hypothetical protein [Candidatus Deferrimicrobiaceae bacterium]
MGIELCLVLGVWGGYAATGGCYAAKPGIAATCTRDLARLALMFSW